MPALFGTCWTLAGDAAPDRGDLRSPHSFAERAEAAASAGFTGIGLRHEDLLVARDHFGWTGVQQILDDTGMLEFEVEALEYWWGDGPERAADDRARSLLLEAASEVGVRHLKVLPDASGQPGSYEWDQGRWAAEFAALAEQCAERGTKLAIEFLPWSNLATLGDALALVEHAGHPAGGLILDIWHTERSGCALEEIAALPSERIRGIELNDAAATMIGSYAEDTMHRRKYCGEGDFDLVGFIQAVQHTGYTGSWGVEILSEEHRKLPLAEAAQRAADSGRRVLAAAGIR